MRINAAIFAALLVAGAAVIELAELVPMGSIIIPVLVIAALYVWRIPSRRYARWGYDVGPDRLRISRGYLFHSDTIIPFGRIQHIDVDQGPVQRRYDLATLSVHTAGSHNDTVSLPGLLHADALALRETIRAHIRSGQR
jgi:membrane protein YdbS with pleckstrin-like domain